MPSFFFHLQFEIYPAYEATRNSDSIQKIAIPREDDWRFDRISFSTVEMKPATTGPRKASTTTPKDGRDSRGIQTDSGSGGGKVSKGRFVPSDPTDEELGWGIVHLYRDGEETPGLYDEPAGTLGASSSRGGAQRGRRERESASSAEEKPPFRDEDCTTLCILAVPSYLTPSDFLGFVGEKTRDMVSHFRMVRTARVNRYMVLMKFRDGRKARAWRREWNGKAFNSMEPENCHVVFVKSIEVQTPAGDTDPSSFPDMTNDPFTPRTTPPPPPARPAPAAAGTSAALSTKPLAPPTPSLVELPTCPVCLERMDETTGLLTILCQHVFHCACLQKWKGCGCPVCRYTQGNGMVNGTVGAPDAETEKLCSVCGSEVNLWICLICGNIGCGRYDEAHAFSHYHETSHSFALDLATQRVWDYTGDEYVHRLIQNKTDGKLVELPGVGSAGGGGGPGPALWDDDDAEVHDAKLDGMSLEYTSLLTSQLDSQRLYFEEKIAQAADKASQASAAAESASAHAARATTALETLHAAHAALEHEAIPALERDRARADRRADKAADTARRLEAEYRDEKAMNASLRDRLAHLTAQLDGGRAREKALADTAADLEDQNRDLAAFISGREKLAELDLDGQGLEEGEVEAGTVTVGEKPEKKGKRRKKKGAGAAGGTGPGPGPGAGPST